MYVTKLVLFLQVVAVLLLGILGRTKSEDWDEQLSKWEKLEEEFEYKKSNRQFWWVVTFLYGNVKVDLSSSNLNNVTEFVEGVNEQMSMLTTGRTLRENAEEGRGSMQFPAKSELPNLLKENNPILSDIPARAQNLKEMEHRVFDAISRTLNFYHFQLDEIKKSDTALTLLLLKDIDNKHGKIFQQKFPLDQWINRVCESTGGQEGDFCHSFVRQWTTSSRKNNPSGDHWKSAALIHNIVNQTDNKMLENIGNERDGMWGALNAQCQMAIVKRCEVPYVCERTLLDPTPRSQYLLTHQLLQRLLVDNLDCPNTKSFVTEQETYTNLCAKMYMEAKYIEALNVPIFQRDLFAEYVGFCGYLGYTNFIREDWLDRIISWQSKSDNGCFVKDSLSPVGVITTDLGFKRRATQKELDQGIQQPNEKCLPHFTAVSLMALSAHWDYLMDSKAMK